MSYTPTNWQTGDKITAEKLNKLENGIAGGGGGDNLFIVTLIYDDDAGKYVADKTFAEIINEFEQGNPLIMGKNGMNGGLSYHYDITAGEQGYNGIEFRFLYITYWNNPVELGDLVLTITPDEEISEVYTSYALTPNVGE